jgi:hypothetical protein
MRTLSPLGKNLGPVRVKKAEAVMPAPATAPVAVQVPESPLVKLWPQLVEVVRSGLGEIKTAAVAKKPGPAPDFDAMTDRIVAAIESLKPVPVTWVHEFTRNKDGSIKTAISKPK